MRRIKSFIPVAVLAFMMVFAALLNPGKAFAAGAADIQKGDLIDIGKADADGYTGEPRWRVLDKDEDGSLFLISEYLWKGDGAENANAQIRFLQSGPVKDLNGQILYWRGTLAEQWCDGFAQAVLGDVQGLAIKPVTKTDEEYWYMQTLYQEDYNKEIHLAAADVILYQNKVFFLSAEEAAQYLPDPRQRKASMPGTDSSEQWLLRSSQAGTNWACEVKPDGEIAAVSAGTGRAVRPAFWADFDSGISFVRMTDESGTAVWTVGEEPIDPPGGGDQEDPQDPPGKTVKAKTVTVNTVSVTAKAVDRAVRKAGGTTRSVTKIVLGKKVKAVKASAFKKYKKALVLEVRTSRLTKRSVRGSLRGSRIKTVRVKVSRKLKTNRKYVVKYKKIFTKKNAGRKVTVKR